MSYTKQYFVDGTVLTAEHLNNIEDGIVSKQDTSNLTTTLDENSDNIHYPSAKAVCTFVETKIDSLDANKVSAIPTTAKGAAGGVASLDTTGKVPSSQLPSYVDDVLVGMLKDDGKFYNSGGAVEMTAEIGKIYVDYNTNKTYRWSGSAYVEISASLALGETSATAYYGDKGKVAYDHSQITNGNPHGISKEDIGLPLVENKTSSMIRDEITKLNITNALGYEPATTTRVSNIEQNIINNIQPYTVNQISLIEAGDLTVSAPSSDGVLVTADISMYSHTDGSSMADGQMQYYVPIVAGDNVTLEKDTTNNVIKINASGGGGSENSVLSVSVSTGYMSYMSEIISAIQAVGGDIGKLTFVTLSGFVTGDLLIRFSNRGDNRYKVECVNLVNLVQINCDPSSDNVIDVSSTRIEDFLKSGRTELATVDKIGLVDTWAGDDIEDLSTADGDGITWSDYFQMQGNEDSGYSELSYGSIAHRVPIVAGNGVEFEIEGNRVKINAAGGSGVDMIASINACLSNEGCWDEEDGIAWDSAYAFYDENGDEITTGTITQKIPLTAGENISFSYDEENNGVAINATMPAATSTTLGGVKLSLDGTTLTISTI